jgi:glycosyltransferase involved in cell wall biosynthesis
MTNKTILATCYAVNPYKGSEDAMGWNFVYQIARFNKVFAITRENNKTAIEKYMAENPDVVYDNITYLYFDLPYWMRFWKKGSRGAMLYYYLWQRGIVSFIKEAKIEFDISHNVNFHNDWTPSFLWKLKKPMVWGPIGHHPKIPTQYLRPFSFKYYLKDRATWLIKKLFWNYSIALKRTAQNASFIWCMNTKVSSHLNLKKGSYSVYPSVATNDYWDGLSNFDGKFNVISVGRFVPLKGFDLTINSFIKFLMSLSIIDRNKCKLTIVGTGPEKEMYQKKIKQNKVEKYIEIIEWIDRNELMKLYKKSSVFLFPSHEGAGMVVAEALSFGLPIICLKNSGPGEFVNEKCGITVVQSDYKTTISLLKNALCVLFYNENKKQKMSFEARKLYQEKFNWESRGKYLKKIYSNIKS